MTTTDVKPRVPLILAGAAPITIPEPPASVYSEARQITFVAGTDTPAHTLAAFRANTTSSNYTDNIKDVDD